MKEKMEKVRKKKCLTYAYTLYIFLWSRFGTKKAAE